ncbi:MAG TPA: MFS transporter [Gemmatimonadales bacterium]|nr:MFS transporter [Gemmatimonadales bacterium]
MTTAPLRTRLAWLGGLSFASGLPYFFFNETIPLWLAQEGMSLAGIGLATGASMPWVLKFLWAPVVDRLGSRRTWIRACLVLLAAVTVLLAGADPTHYAAALGVLLLVYVTLSATQDIAIDAYTIETTSGRELGVANSVRIAAYRGASFVSSALLVWVAARRGWDGAFLAGAAITGTLAAASFLLPETERGSQRAESLTEPLTAMLRRPGIWAVILFALTFKLDISAMDPMTKPFWLQAGLTLDQIAVLTTGRLIATLAGATIGGLLATRIGLFRALWTMGLVQLLSSLGYAAAAALPPDRAVISAAALFENFAAGLGTAAFLAFLMSVCERRYAATQFALLTAVYALSRWAVGLVSGVLAERLGFAHYFLLTFALGVPAYGLLPWIRGAGVETDREGDEGRR